MQYLTYWYWLFAIAICSHRLQLWNYHPEKKKVFLFGLLLFTTVHSRCDGYSINISACRVWRGKNQDSRESFKRILLDKVRTQFYLRLKKKKNEQLRISSKRLSTGLKHLSPDHLSEISIRMNGCNTWMNISPPNIFLPEYLSPISSSQQQTSPSLFFIQLTGEPSLKYKIETPPLEIGFECGFSSFHKFSLTHKVCVYG